MNSSSPSPVDQWPDQNRAQNRGQNQDGLDPLRFPLHGQRLIEASAGTGKTFTLALLYTRLVLGHGPGGSAFDRPLTPPEILVVTFTEAATKELRSRIRDRLVEAAECFTAGADAPIADAMLTQLRDQCPVDDWPSCARRLRQAADWMDEAMIATIHGFCQRMLQEHAFATRGLFQRELVTDQSELLDEALRDYWRLHFYPLSAEQIGCIQAIVVSPDALKGKLRDWLSHSEAPISHAGKPVLCEDLRAPLAAACKQRQREEAAAGREDKARDLWQAHREKLEAMLWELRPHLDGTKHGSASPEKFQTVLGELADWSQGGAAPKKLNHFAQSAFKFKKSAKVQQAPAHPAFQAIADWQAEVQHVTDTSDAPDPPLAAQLLAHAANWLRRELPRRLGQRAEMGFDDLLRDLDAALNPPEAASVEQLRAEALAATLRTQFPVALIDEFQDTDPLQYRIFARIYAPEPVPEPEPEPAEAPASSETETPRPALIMIGDPKQAIYGFRGADIHAYLAAREAARGQLYTLKKNYRSTESLVEACNHFFEHAERHLRGAFRFRCEAASGDNPIPYVPVSASGRPDHLLLNQQPAPAMTLWWLDGEDGTAVGSTEYRQTMAEVAASEIVRWLQAAREGKAGFKQADDFRSLRPRDIAILVRTGTEAAAMREALGARQVNSVYLSDRDSVFNTAEAVDLCYWLQACADPNDEALVRAALGTNTLALPLEQFADWQRDELAWEAQLERFRDYRQVWQRQGVLAALHRLMHDQALPARLLARPEGERRLTNLLHLAEWLQQAATQMDGEQALIRHLSEHLGQNESNDESIVRLESDAELVQVVTIHKSKGLEYPLVLLPFICSWREVNGRVHSVPYRPDPAQGALERTIEVAGKDAFPEAWKQADDVRLSEDMRLLYVAMTRASYGLWLGIAPLKSGNSKRPQLEKSALGYALNGGEMFPTNEAVYQCLGTLASECKAMALVPAPEVDRQRLMAEEGETLEPACEAEHRPFAPWWISSYSALRLGMTAAIGAGAEESTDSSVWSLAAETANQETALEESALSTAASLDQAVDTTQMQAQPPPSPSPPEEQSRFPVSLHDFPRGSRSGTFLHGLLEWAGRAESAGSAFLQTGDAGHRVRGFPAAVVEPLQRREMLARRCALRGLEHWIDPLNDWLGAVLTQPWALRGLADQNPGDSVYDLVLESLAPSQMQVEMEFWIQTRGVDLRRLDELVQQHCLPGEARPQLRAGRLNGMLKGFIDLVFEHQGRFYVLDWKSNWLGADDSAYTDAAMRHAILHHRYDLQYLLYLLALHRLLGARLPDYDYDRHIGGAVYVFLRGASAASQGIFTNRPPRALIEGLGRLFAGTADSKAGQAAQPGVIA